MISVVIAYMPRMPYEVQLKSCLIRLKKQDCEPEIIVSEMPLEQYINKPRLINQGIEKAKGEYIWLCDADFNVEDPTLLSRMQAKLNEGEHDIIYPQFESRASKKMRIADGAPFAKRETFEKFGPWNEKHLGISWVTFPFLWWALKKCRIHCSEEFVFVQNSFPFTLGRKKRHFATSKGLFPLFKKTKKELEGMGLWNV
jgi:glycosyltransferase involved in cell wall biosynthesis